MVGLPGSGKTTYARRRLGQALRISLDDLRLMLTGRTFDPRVEPAVAVLGHAALSAMLSNARAWGVDVVFDATNISREWRRRSLQLAAQYDVVPIAVYLDAPFEAVAARNRRRSHPVPDEVMERFRSQMEPPDISEGFAEVVLAADGG
jgi:predicted kinase